MADDKRFSFTQMRLAGLPRPAAGRTVYYDRHTPGLTLRITENGSRSFYFYRKVKGRPMRLFLGRFPEMTVANARKACQRTSGAVAEGKDPQAERQAARHEQILAGLFAYWLDTHAKHRKRTWKEDERQYNAFLKPWANRSLATIHKSDVQALHAHVGQKHGHYAANRLLALIKAMFNKGSDMGFTGVNPAIGINKFPEEKRDRFLHGEELRSFFTALAAEPHAMLRDFFMVSLLTGARRSNVQSMRWEDIDFQAGIWRIPDTKSGLPVVVPLVAPVVQILQTRLQAANDSPWVFPGRGKSGHIVEPKSAWKRIIQGAGLTDVRPHDLRRSLGSWMAMTGAGLPMVGKMLGHTQPTTTAIYARLAVDPVRQAAEKATDAMLQAGGVKLIETQTPAADTLPRESS